MFRQLRAALVGSALLASACGGDASSPAIPSNVTVVSGGSQSAVVATALPAPVVVQVDDDKGKPIRGASVTWAADGGTVSAATSTTDASGQARVTWTMDTRSGEKRLTATSGRLPPVTVLATARAAAPASITLVGGQGQNGVVGQQLAGAVTVRVTDSHGNGVPSVPVQFSPGATDGTVAGATATNAAGEAEVRWTLGGRVGEQALVASTPGVTATMRITAIAAVGAPAAVTRVGTATLTGVVGATLAPVVVRVVDSFSNPVPGATVAFSTANGGTLTPSSATTAANGEAQTSWRLGTAPGTQLMRATATTGAGVDITAAAQVGPAATMTRLSAAAQTASAGQTITAPLAVRVLDAFGNPVPGATVQFATGAGAGSVQPASVVTAADGQAQSTWTVGTVVGQQSVVASVAGFAAANTSFSATVQPAAVATVTLQPDSLLLTALGQTAQLTATARDAFGNSTGTAGITWATANAFVATVDGNGMVRAVSVGQTSVQASLNGIIRTAQVRVAPPVTTMDVVLAGLPPGVNGGVVVTGTGMSPVTVNATGRITLPGAGAYGVSAAAVSSGGTTYTPNPASQVVNVAAGTNGTATISYTATVPVTQLASGVPVTGLSGAPATQRHFRISVPAGASSLVVSTTGASANVNLYVRRGAQATPALYDCRPLLPGGNETCTLTSPAAGDWYVMLDAVQAYANASLLATVTVPPAPGTLALSILGLPGGAAGSVTVSGTGYNSTHTASQSVQLAPGSYTVTAAAVTSGASQYTPTPASQNVTITSGAASNAVVTYSTTSGPPLLTSGTPVTGLSGTVGSQSHYRIVVPSGTAVLTVATTASTDVDLYVRRGAQASSSQNDCARTSISGNETCTINQPAAGDWYIMMLGYAAYSGATLTATTAAGTGNIALTVNGLPAGVNAAVTVTGPNSFSTTATATRTITGLAAGTYNVAAAQVASGGNTYAASQASQNVTVTAGLTSSATVAYSSVTQGGANLKISAMHVTQSVQSLNGNIELVAGRPALLRVFGTGSNSGNAAPSIRVRIYRNGTLQDTRTITRAGTVPANADEAQLAGSWNVALAGSLVQPGMSVLADIDPTNAVAESNEADNSFPTNGTALALTVRTVPTLQARLVSVRQANGLVGDVSNANRDAFLEDAIAMFPFSAVDADVSGTVFNSAFTVQADGTAWGTVLAELAAANVVSGSQRLYYGVLKAQYNSGVFGVGYVPGRAAIGLDYTQTRSGTLAHEWGHNFGRPHVPCGDVGGADPSYPHAGGITNTVGYDGRTGGLVASSRFDLMSYCEPVWISDYTYNAVLAYRGQMGGTSALPAQRTMLVWGRIAGRGQLVLEPAFELTTRPVLPSGRGRYRIEGFDERGQRLFSHAFDGDQVDHSDGERHFAFAIPVGGFRGQQPVEIRLFDGLFETRVQAGPAGTAEGASETMALGRTGAGMARLQWDASRSPVVLVRDPATGEVVAFARGGDVSLRTNAQELELSTSDGVRSAGRRVTVR